MEGLYISELAARLATGDLSATILADYYLERIGAYDQSGPNLNAVLTLNPEAMDEAAALDQEIRTNGPRSRLHGVPVLLKDNIATVGPMATTAGSRALKGAVANRDAHIVMLLKQAGALILGKTNMSEWANFRSSNSSSGWSSLGGQTRNPYSLDRSPGGSSAGSGVAVAADFCTVAVGTETDGSIVSPSSLNGIVGIKPTVGLVSRSGIIPISASQDTAGPMARNVADAAMLLNVLAGSDPEDAASSGADQRREPDYTEFVRNDGLAGARIGVARNYCRINDHVDAIFETALETIAKAGAEVVDPVSLPKVEEISGHERRVLVYEFKDGVNAYLKEYLKDFPIQSLADIIKFNHDHAEQVMPYFGQDILLKSEQSGPLSDETYITARAACRRLGRADGIDKTLADHNLDALVAPSRTLAWPIDWATGDGRRGGSSTVPAIAGYPMISVPMGYAFGMPAGLSFFAGAYAEGRLIQLASGFEHVAQMRRQPSFREEIFTRGLARQATP